MSPYLSVSDLIMPPLFIMVIIMFSLYVKNKNLRKNSAYKYYVAGILVKIIGSISICLVYTLYYSSGDSTGYYEQGGSICNLLYKDPSYFFEVLFQGCTAENYYYLDQSTTYISYGSWVSDYKAMFISRLVAPLFIISFNSFIAVTILLCWICYSGVWKLYLLFCEQFPEIKSQLAISILFIPSVIFWGSGLLKDTVTLACIGWYSYSFYYLLVKKEYNFKNIIYILLSAYLLISLKPYILFALLPGSLIWLSYEKITSTKNKAIRLIIAPLMIIGGVAGGFYALSSLGGALGEYSVDTVLERAVVVQKDLKSDYYGGNSFDIGDFDASIGGVLSKSPLAINATLFRPYLWEVRNPLMLLSSLESTYIFFLTLGLMLRLKFLGFFRYIWQNPLLLFAVLFALFFAFSVGLSTPNFGALSRLKIPCIPFFVSSLFVLRHLYEVKTQKKFGF
jgi:hypothetical protein